MTHYWVIFASGLGFYKREGVKLSWVQKREEAYKFKRRELADGAKTILGMNGISARVEKFETSNE